MVQKVLHWRGYGSDKIALGRIRFGQDYIHPNSPRGWGIWKTSVLTLTLTASLNLAYVRFEFCLILGMVRPQASSAAAALLTL